MAAGAQVTMTTDGAAVAIASSSIGPLRVTVRNRGTGTIYLGSSGVTTSASYALSTEDSPLSVFLMGGEVLYGCSTGGAVVVEVLKTGATT